MADTGGGVSEVQYLNTMFAADTVPDVVNAPYWGIGAGGEGVCAAERSPGRHDRTSPPT